MTRETRIARPQFRQARDVRQRLWFAAPCCAIPRYNHCGFAVRISSPRKPAAGFYAGAATAILSGSGTVTQEPVQDFYHRSRKVAGARGMHGERHITQLSAQIMGARPRRQSETDVEAKKEMSPGAAATGAHFRYS